MGFPVVRMRRLRQNAAIRRLLCETRLVAENLVAPIFVCQGKSLRIPLESMPGQYRFSPDEALREVRELRELGIPAVLLFGVPRRKDSMAKSAYAADGIVQQTVRLIREKIPDILIVTDVCLCQYTDHGHCGLVKKKRDGTFTVDNDATLELLSKVAVSHARAGAHVVAPSAMMDGQVKAIREALDGARLAETLILGYSAKFASSFYGPFREAAESSPSFGDRSTYQMNPAQVCEALREVQLDIEEGADIVMVKPALAYLDIIRRVREKFSIPVAAFNVSGEYSMVKSAAEKGWLDEKRVTLEILTSIKRAGADIIITYHAKSAASYLREEHK
jgi:porphobilinogen synthase